jgi:hypothetical protein
MIIRERTFSNELVELDFNRFEECAFVACKIVYRGYSPPDFIECRFENCEYTFDGPAGNLLAFLKSMHASPARQMTEGLIAYIQGKGEETPSVRGVTH